MPIFQWESKFCGYKIEKGHIKGPGEQQERQPQGSGQGVVHFFQICIWYMFICQFFKENPNSRLQVWQRSCRGSRRTTRTATPGTRAGSSSFFSNIHMIHVYIPIFQYESEFWGYKCDKGYVEGPGEQWEQQPQGPGQGVVHFFKYVCDTYTWPLSHFDSQFGLPLKNWHINMYHMCIWKKWTTPRPGPWGCRSRSSPGPSILPLSHLKRLNSDSHWKIDM